MQRLVDLDTVGMALDNYTNAEYEVAIDRHENLWEVKAHCDERINFLYAIGVVNEKERKVMLEESEKIYNKFMAISEDKDMCNVGF